MCYLRYQMEVAQPDVRDAGGFTGANSVKPHSET